MLEEETKVCPVCEKEKDLNDFGKKGRGLDNTCKKCRAAKAREHYKNNKEKLKARINKYRKENREKILKRKSEYRKKNRELLAKKQREYVKNNPIEKERNILRSKKYREANPEKVKANRKKHYQENAEKIKARHKKYRQENPEKGRLYRHRRRALLLEATTEDFTHEDLLTFWSENEISHKECFYCEKEMPEGPEHIDHYYPLSKGGPHERANLRPSCAHCNLVKSAKQPETFIEELNNGL
jgi:Zn ribbon nucleic-acid-binding protein